jgi:hypothetical protein
MAGNNGYPGKDLIAKLQGGDPAAADPTNGYAGRAILAKVGAAPPHWQEARPPLLRTTAEACSAGSSM